MSIKSNFISSIYFSKIENSLCLDTKSTTIFTVLDGSLCVNGENLSVGDIFICSLKENILSPKPQAVLLSATVQNQFVLDNLPELTNFESDKIKLKSDEKFCDRLKSYALDYLNQNFSEFKATSLAYLLLDKISESFNLENNEEFTSKSNALHKDIADYLSKNIFSEITQLSTAEKFSVTPHYVGRLFKANTGLTFHNYLLNIRTQKAKAYLKYTDLTIDEIKDKLRLKDFSLDECTHISQDNTLPTFFNISEENARSYLSASEASPVIQNENSNLLDISKQPTLLYPVWNELINLGYASSFSSSDIIEHIVKTQNEIHFRYGRICRPFDVISSYSVGNKIIYDFNPLFSVFDVLTANNMYPFLELGNKRLRIQLTLVESLITEESTSTEEHFARTLDILPYFLRSSINRYGYDSVKHWKFELCSPNHDIEHNTVEDFPMARYIHYFCKIKSCINSLVPEAKVGGPGFINLDRPDTFERLLKEFKSAPVEPDFFTSYMFPIINSENFSQLSPDENILEKRMKTLSEIVKKIYPTKDLLITEYNSNLSTRSYLNDSSYQATFTAQSIFACTRLGIRALGYYMLSDAPLRYADTQDMLFGGWGLLSDTNLPKPSFHAWHFFSMLGKYLHLMTDRCILTSNSETSFQCILYHYEHIANEYNTGNISREEFKISDKLFIHSDAQSYTIKLDELPKGLYTVKTYTVSQSKSNLLYNWSKFHFITDKNILDTLDETSSLNQTANCYEVDENSPLTLTQTLCGQEIKLITIELFHKGGSNGNN
jgi:beta-xylosidase/AraC-like DNA-binding protein